MNAEMMQHRIRITRIIDKQIMLSGRMVLIFVSILPLLSCSGDVTTEQPNIILCMADDQGWFEAGYQGHPYVKTPVMDEMARKGIRFNAFYAGAPVCTPTRASVMTGRHSNRSGAFNWNYSFRPEEITIARLVREAGYSTGHFGKWHLGPVKKGSPVNPGAMGFDYWLSHDNFFGYNPPLSENGTDPQEFRGESSEILVRNAIAWIRNCLKKKKPFFAVIWFGSPHGPYAASDVDYGPYSKLRWSTKNPMIPHRYGEITAMDRAMGELRQFLREREIAGNTLLWYCSDNGIPGEVALEEEPLRGHKSLLYENGIRVPALIEWPDIFPEPAVIDIPCVTSDILPTLCDYLCIGLPDRPLDGISLRPVLEGELSERPEPICFWYHDFRKEEDYNLEWYMDKELLLGNVPTSKVVGIQFHNFVDVSPLTKDYPGIAAIRDNRYKLVEPSPGVFELYDIQADPGEQNDLAAGRPEITEKLMDQLRTWQSDVERSLSGADYK
jgi:arylsulfatase A-like enzyme